jgi:translation initiation factor eIF-2B subunit delta
VRSVVESVTETDPEDVATAKGTTRDAIDRVVGEIDAGKGRAAENAAEHVSDGATLLTHDYSSTVLEALEIAAAGGAHVEVYATEARPRYLGRKTVRVLAEMGRVEPHLLVDSACGHVLPECDEVVVGMDCIVDDTLYNRVGTFPIAATAAQLDVPVTVVGSGAKIIDDGFVFENEFRSPSEVMREPAEGFSIENPAYDATPTELIDRVITDEGVRHL